MTTSKSAVDTAAALGELKGLMQGLRDMIADQHVNMNRRMDDMHHSNTRRLDDLNNSLGQRLTKNENDLARVEKTADDAKELAARTAERVDAINGKVGKTSLATGAGAGTLVSIGIELIKQFVWPS